MKYTISITFILYVLFSTVTMAQRLEKFAARGLGKERNGVVAQAAYPDVVNYFGYLLPDSISATPRPFKTYLYFWLREDVYELGIRVISPVPEYVFPDKGDIASEKYMINEKDKAVFFNPLFILSKAKGISSSLQYNTKPSEIEWNYLLENDKSVSDQSTPGTRKNQAVTRIYDAKKSDSKINKAGYYRIEISTADTILVSGSFLVQIGTTSEIKVLKLSEKEEGH